MSAFANIAKIPELRKRLLFTLGMLAVYRVGIFVTTPGVNRSVMRRIVKDQSGTLLGMFNMFSGGALEQLSIFALGIMPYVTASIILQMMGVVVKPLEELRKEGEAGQRKINQYTRYATVGLSIFQSFGIALYLESLNGNSPYGDVVAEPGWGFRFLTVIALTTGTCFLMWIGEQIQERGVGNGISLLIFAGIVANLPIALAQTYEQVKIGQMKPITLLILAFLAIIVVAIIVFFERAQRRIPIQYAKRRVGNKIYGGQTSHLPLKVNSAGVIPPILASSLLTFPFTLQNLNVPGMDWLQANLQPDSWFYLFAFAAMCMFFCFFWVSLTIQPVEMAENLRKQSANIPGIRPGTATENYIDGVLSRITVGGAIYITAICTIPTILQSEYRVPFYFGGTSLMIVVGVALDTVQQIEAHLITRNYEALTGRGGTRIRGRQAEE